MAITAYDLWRVDSMVTVSVISSLAADQVTVYYYWYRDGAYVNRTIHASQTFFVPPGEQQRIDVVDSLDPDLDVISSAPAGYPARQAVYWIRSLNEDVTQYRIEQKVGTGIWTAIGWVTRSGRRWQYSFNTPRLADLTDHQWRIIPINDALNDGQILTLDVRRIVRTPDAPNFTVTYLANTNNVRFDLVT